VEQLPRCAVDDDNATVSVRPEQGVVFRIQGQFEDLASVHQRP
jgi:hypothetical protein